MARVCHKWGYTNILWKNANWKWSECQLVAEVVSYLGVDASQIGKPPWEDEIKRKKLIQLICKVKGEDEYNSTKEKRENIKIEADDIKLVVKAVLGIDVDVSKLKDKDV